MIGVSDPYRPGSTTFWSAGSANPRGRPEGLLLFACGDNLRKGAALNAVQIAERVL